MTLKEVNNILSSREGISVEFKTVKELLFSHPHIAQIFTQIGLSEELGTGIKKVFKYSKHYSGISEIEFLEKDVFITRIPLGNILQKNTNIDNFTDNFTDKNTRIQQVLSIIEKNESVTSKELAALLNVTKRTIISDLSLLKKNKLIERVGNHKSGYWQTIKKE